MVLSQPPPPDMAADCIPQPPALPPHTPHHTQPSLEPDPHMLVTAPKLLLAAPAPPAQGTSPLAARGPLLEACQCEPPTLGLSQAPPEPRKVHPQWTTAEASGLPGAGSGPSAHAGHPWGTGLEAKPWLQLQHGLWGWVLPCAWPGAPGERGHQPRPRRAPVPCLPTALLGTWPDATQPGPLLRAGGGWGSGPGAQGRAQPFQRLPSGLSRPLYNVHCATRTARKSAEAISPSPPCEPPLSSAHCRAARKEAGAPPTRGLPGMGPGPRAGVGSDPSPPARGHPSFLFCCLF